MNNAVETKSISQLRDSRVFYIPAYQRGYRWNKKQVDDLLSDLYSFARRKDKAQGEFYCLQPVIVKEIIDKQKIQQIKADNKDLKVADETKFYEVIDGQQRLTTLYIVLRYLITTVYASDEDERDRYLAELYQITFETRKEMFHYLSHIEERNKQIENIDEKHAAGAFQWIQEWVKDTVNSSDDNKKDITDCLEQLLRQKKETTRNVGSVQVIWYEIAPEKNVIREFLATNNGKISLTDAELVKALFLRKRNFSNDAQQTEQISRAVEWERIENTLHQDDFWHFISSDKRNPSNRIELVLRLASGVESSEEKAEQNPIFSHYNQLFERDESVVEKQWQTVVECFRCIEDWYVNPLKYNYIGFLTHTGTSLTTIYNKYRTLLNDDAETQHHFIDELHTMVKHAMRSIHIQDNGYTLNKKYQDSADMRMVLLLLNIHVLNQQITGLNAQYEQKYHRSFNSPSYKFPFDVYVGQGKEKGWDIEHIDSRTPNGSDEEKREWVEKRMSAMKNNADFQKAYEEACQPHKAQEKAWEKCIELIQAHYGEDNDGEDIKDQICNLTLLDGETNRSYGNNLFPEKQERILEEINKGKFVPFCTQTVFFKTFNKAQMKSNRWDRASKEAYGRYICQQIKEYLKQD